MDIGEDDFVQSDEDFDDKKHEKLLDKILSINKSQQLKKSSRTEPAIQISEFDLAKSITGKTGVIHVGDLTNVLQKKKAHVTIKKKVDTSSKITSTLPKPLEKPLADQITRTVAYEKARLELDRWEPIITANRVSTDLLFPIPTRDYDKNVDLTKKWTVKSAFDIELEKNSPQLVEEIQVDTQKVQSKMTLKELKEKRRELAKIRAKLSYQEAKARRQNKIKSKKYHRIQKKTKIKQQLKEFEELKKTKPEEALKKLEEIERIRAQERFSLRHKSTGKWAKHKQIHAKYDKESRAELAEQLKLSKELTQKVTTNSDSEDDDFDPALSDDNFMKQTFSWFKEPENSEFSREETSGNTEAAEEENTSNQGSQMLNEEESAHSNIEVPEKEKTTNESTEVPDEQSTIKKSKMSKKDKQTNNNSKTNNGMDQTPTKNNDKQPKKRKISSLNTSSTSDWDVELMDDNIDVIFDEMEKKMNEKLKKEGNEMMKRLAPKKATKKKQKVDIIEEEKESLLALPIERKRPRIDEPLMQTSKTKIPEGELSDLNSILKKSKMNIDKDKAAPKETKKSEKIKGNKKQTVTQLDTIIPDMITNMDDYDEDDNDIFQQELKEEAADAFQDDLVQQFAKEKAETREKNKPKDVNLFLPGWGSWGGVGIVQSKRKRKRFIVKAPKKVPRRDDNRGFLIINEDADKKVKQHMVDELPFPFQRVKDFEASIRAPIGRTFVPEMAFRKLIKPAIKTKIGAVIEPMDKDVLFKDPKL